MDRKNNTVLERLKQALLLAQETSVKAPQDAVLSASATLEELAPMAAPRAVPQPKRTLITDYRGWVLQGPMEQWVAVRAIFGAIFSRAPFVEFGPGQKLPVQRFRNGTVLGVEYKGSLYVEQNPATGSTFAARARRGEKIIWVIRVRKEIDVGGRKQMVKTNEYVGRIDKDGVWKKTSAY